MGTKPTSRRPSRRQLKQSAALRRWRIAVVGLDGIGRRLATLLAASGVEALLLIDHRTVTRRTQRREGYSHDQIGCMRAHAAAQACHEINPKMEVVTDTGRSAPDLSGADVVVVCCGQHRRQTAQTEAIPLVHLVQVGSGGGQTRIECSPAAPPVSPAMPASALASIIAGLAVHEIHRWPASGPAARRTRQIELYDVKIRILSRL